MIAVHVGIVLVLASILAQLLHIASLVDTRLLTEHRYFALHLLLLLLLAIVYITQIVIFQKLK